MADLLIHGDGLLPQESSEGRAGSWLAMMVLASDRPDERLVVHGIRWVSWFTGGRHC